MYLWNVEALINDFKTDKITEKEKFKYIVFIFVFGSWYMSTPVQHSMEYFSYYMNALQTTLTILGLYLCYKANYQGDNKDFLSRLICLTIPISIRIGVYLILVALFITLMIPALGIWEIDVFELSFTFVYNVIFYFYMRCCVIKIASNKT